MRPTDIGNGHTISGYFRRWRREGRWARVIETLPQWERQSHGLVARTVRAVPIATVSRQPRQAQTWALTGRYCQVVGDDMVTRPQQALSGRDVHRPEA